MEFGQRSRRRPERWPEPPQTRQQTGSRHSRTGCLGERHRKQSFFRFIMDWGAESEGAVLEDEIPKAGEQGLPAHGADEMEGVTPGASVRAQLLTERSRSNGEGWNCGKRRSVRGAGIAEAGDTPGVCIEARGQGSGRKAAVESAGPRRTTSAKEREGRLGSADSGAVDSGGVDNGVLSAAGIRK
jgi:hypothetical protein